MVMMRELYQKEIAPALKKQLGLTSSMQIPDIEKIVINMSLGEAVRNPKVIEAATEELAAIAGQKPVVTKAKKAISNFKLRQGMPLGVMVTLRKDKAWTFLEKMIHLTLPRVRDFRGLSPKGFDGRGNYNMGLKEQIVFPEINYDRIETTRGMNITVCTSAKDDASGRALLEALGMPFRK